LRVLGGLDDLDGLVPAHQVDAIVVSTRKLSPERELRLRAIADARNVRVYHLNIGLVELTDADHLSGQTAGNVGAAGIKAAAADALTTDRGVVPPHHAPGSA